MKVFSVSDTCIACGECLLSTDLLVNDGEGYAVPALGRYIDDGQQLKAARQLVEQCPVHALSIVEKNSVSAEGEAGLLQLAEVLEKRMRAVEIPDISNRELEFKESEYHIEHGWVDERKETYPTWNKACKAGEEQFKAVYWNHMQAFVTSALSQYKSKVLRKYYDLSDPKHTYYAQIGTVMANILGEIQGEACSLGLSPWRFPKGFTNFCPEEDRDFQRYVKNEYKNICSIDFVKQFCENFAREDRRRGRDFQYIGQIVAEEYGSVEVKSFLGSDRRPTFRMMDVNKTGLRMIENLLTGLSYAGEYGLRDLSLICEDNLAIVMGEYRKLVDKAINEKVSILKQLASGAMKEFTAEEIAALPAKERWKIPIRSEKEQEEADAMGPFEVNFRPHEIDSFAEVDIMLYLYLGTAAAKVSPDGKILKIYAVRFPGKPSISLGDLTEEEVEALKRPMSSDGRRGVYRKASLKEAIASMEQSFEFNRKSCLEKYGPNYEEILPKHRIAGDSWRKCPPASY